MEKSSKKMLRWGKVLKKMMEEENAYRELRGKKKIILKEIAPLLGYSKGGKSNVSTILSGRPHALTEDRIRELVDHFGFKMKDFYARASIDEEKSEHQEENEK